MASQVDPAAVVREQLSPGERLLWSGVPVQGLRLQGIDAVLIPFSLFVGASAILWEWLVISRGAPLFFVLLGAPVVLLGAHLVAGRFVWDAYRRRRTAYGVTDQRVVIVVSAWSARVTTLPLRNITDMTLSEGGGRGSIRFGSLPTSASWLAGAAWPGAPAIPMLDAIGDVRHVHELIRNGERAAA